MTNLWKRDEFDKQSFYLKPDFLCFVLLKDVNNFINCNHQLKPKEKVPVIVLLSRLA
jgi:hypothetical protein